MQQANVKYISKLLSILKKSCYVLFFKAFTAINFFKRTVLKKEFNKKLGEESIVKETKFERDLF